MCKMKPPCFLKLGPIIVRGNCSIAGFMHRSPHIEAKKWVIKGVWPFTKKENNLLALSSSGGSDIETFVVFSPGGPSVLEMLGMWVELLT